MNMVELKLSNFSLLAFMSICLSACTSTPSTDAENSSSAIYEECAESWVPHRGWLESELAAAGKDDSYWLLRSGGDLSKELGYSAIYKNDNKHFFRSSNVKAVEPHVMPISEREFEEIEKVFEQVIKNADYGRQRAGAGFPTNCFTVIKVTPSSDFEVRHFSSDHYENGVFGLVPVDPIYKVILRIVP